MWGFVFWLFSTCLGFSALFGFHPWKPIGNHLERLHLLRTALLDNNDPEYCEALGFRDRETLPAQHCHDSIKNTPPSLAGQGEGAFCGSYFPVPAHLELSCPTPKRVFSTGLDVGQLVFLRCCSSCAQFNHQLIASQMLQPGPGSPSQEIVIPPLAGAHGHERAGWIKVREREPANQLCWPSASLG